MMRRNAHRQRSELHQNRRSCVFRLDPETFRILSHNRSKAILDYHKMPEKDITLATLKTNMRTSKSKSASTPKSTVLALRKLEKKVNALDKRVRQLQEEKDDVLTEEDIKAIRKAEAEYRAGKTVRIA